MTKIHARQLLVSLLAVIALAGCDSIPFIDTTSDYKAAGRGKPLEVPPDLTSVSASDTYNVPGSATYSQYSEGQGQQEQDAEKLLPDGNGVKLERAGSQRWLVVQAAPEKVWPVVREFWNDMGFAVRIENTQTGVMETEWVDASNLTKDKDGNYIDKFQGWLDKLNALNTRQKFRTRIDRGGDEGTTEIYLSHRAIADAVSDDKEKVRTRFGEIENGYKLDSPESRKARDTRAEAEDIDAELLRRLMVRLGVEEKQSQAIMASANNEKRASLGKDKSGNATLTVNDPFDRAWRRVGLALDRVGFLVEDKDRTRGVFYVRYSDIAAEDANGPQKKKGLLSKLKFWGDDDDDQDKKPVADDNKDDKKRSFWGNDKSDREKQYRIQVEHGDETSQITVADKNGKPDNSPTAGRILSMLFDQLK